MPFASFTNLQMANSVNLLMIGRTYLCLNDKEKARLYLTRARDYPVITSEDAEV